MPHTPLRTAVVGIGGFGDVHHRSLLSLEESGVVKVVATCDPMASKLTEAIEKHRFAERGVAVYESFDALLNAHGDQLDLCTIAAPIRFHAAMHRACVERGIACYLEKPPTLDPVELEEMIATDTKAAKATNVGFNYIYEEYRHDLKKRVLSGEFGPLKQVSMETLWPRTFQYYGRNNWAGRLFLDGDYIVLDSVCGNATAHHVQNLLFFAGSPEESSYPVLQKLEAELYRANQIEGADTIFARGTFTNGVEIRIAATHACGGSHSTREILECEKATISLDLALPEGEIRHLDGTVTRFPYPRKSHVTENIRHYCEYVLGNEPAPTVSLADSRPFVQLNALFYIAAGRIHSVIEPHRQKGVEQNTNHPFLKIEGVETACTTLLSEGKLPSEAGLPWAQAGGSASPADLGSLRAVLHQNLA